MPSLKIKLRTEASVQNVLTLSSVPQRLCDKIRRACNAIPGTVDGKPELEGDEDLVICFPRVGLTDWIQYKWTVRGELENEGHAQGPIQGRSARQAPDRDFANGSIVLSLESPHKEEIKHGRPAAGKTGENLEAHRHHLKTFLTPLIQQLDRSPTWQSLPFVIANPCPYPASCLIGIKKWPQFRDLVFEHLFPLVQDEFLTRLVRYRPRILINACTNGAQDDGGNIIFPDPNGGHMILQGTQPASPNALVKAQIERFVGQQNFWRSHVKCTSDGFDLEDQVPQHPVPGVLINAPHPASWRNAT